MRKSSTLSIKLTPPTHQHQPITNQSLTTPQPTGVPGEDSRITFFRLSKQCFLPGSSISFPEIVLADAFTSISKVLKDLGVTLVALYCAFTGEAMIDHHENGMCSALRVLRSKCVSVSVCVCVCMYV
jgi:hypothetical protein